MNRCLVCMRPALGCSCQTYWGPDHLVTLTSEWLQELYWQATENPLPKEIGLVKGIKSILERRGYNVQENRQ